VITDFVSGTDKLSIAQAISGFAGNFSSVASAQAAVNASALANQAYFVTTDAQLYISTASTGIASGTDTVVTLTGVTALTGADLGIGTQGAGSTITISAANAVLSPTVSTNASAVTTVKDDAISFALAASAVGSTIDGGAGVDTVTITPTIAGLNASTLYSNVEKVNFTVGNTCAFVLPLTANMGVENKSASAALTVTFGAAAQPEASGFGGHGCRFGN
jgi:hypothetical protein